MSATVIEIPEPANTAVEPHLIIRPPRGWSALNLIDLWQFRDLMFELAGRDVKLRYKQTILGPIWIVLQPLLGAGAFSFVFGKVANLQNAEIPNYFLFSYAGLLGWNLFSTTLTKTSGCLVGNSHLISKIFFPRLVLPLSVIPSVLLDFFVSLGVMIVLLLVTRTPVTIQLIWLPVWTIILLLLSMGVGLCTAALAVSYRDVQMLLPVLTQILQLACPVVYALSRVPARFLRWYMLNPLVGVISAFRWSILPGYGACKPPGIGSVLYALAAGIVVFVLGAYSFKRMERKFADVI
jgi:lipopolysaccharide transport system permease protein